MSKLQIITYPNDILRKKSKSIEIFNIDKYQKFIDDMIEIMVAKDGVGLAAPQVGYNVNIIVVNKDILNTDDFIVLCNPKITFLSAKKIEIEEGCLSLPGTYGNVKRPEKIRIKAFNRKGAEIIIKAKGIMARVIQHEIDHLLGVLFIDKLEK